MARDDPESSSKKKRLPARVERALAKAREATREDAKRKGGRWLALVPVAAALLSFLMMMPHATEPESVPLPEIDERVLRQVRDADEARARAALAQRLPSDVLEIGSAIRAIHNPKPDQDEREFYELERVLHEGVRQVSTRPDGLTDLLKLRALQTHTFVEELEKYESTGQESDELRGLAGEFVERIRSAGWIVGNELILDEWQRRVVFKAMWTRLTGLDLTPELKLALDEERALYALYLRHPHPPEQRREEIDAQRRSAMSPEACKRAAWEETRATELWRAEKIKSLAAIDPTYPASYALGVAYYRAGRYDLATDAFRDWIDRHPDGALAIRARNHLKASLAMYGTL